MLEPLTSLRFIAAMLIVIHHSAAYFGLSEYSAVLALPQGVSFFFILSGFILSYNHSDTRASDWKLFYLNRFARLWPAHIAAAALWLYFGYPGFVGVEKNVAIFATITNLTLTQSFIPFSAFYSSINPVAWSISVEVFFYLVFPLIVAGGIVSASRWLAASFALLVAIITAVVLFDVPNATEDPMGVSVSSIIYSFPLARLFEFCLGCFTAFLFKKYNGHRFNKQTLLEIAALGLVILSMALTASQEFRMLLPPYYPVGAWTIWSGSCIPMAVLIYVMAVGGGKVSKALSNRVIVYLGEISFSLYLVHLTMLCIFMVYAQSLPSSFAGFSIYIAASIAMSALLYHAIENPCRRIIKSLYSRFKKPNVLPRSLRENPSPEL